MVDTDSDYNVTGAEREKFIVYFAVIDQTWAAWDEDVDGNVSVDEFQIGFNYLKIFDERDSDKGTLIRECELASGVFNSWDHSKDGLLSRTEYQQKFYTYLVR